MLWELTYLQLKDHNAMRANIPTIIWQQQPGLSQAIGWQVLLLPSRVDLERVLHSRAFSTSESWLDQSRNISWLDQVISYLDRRERKAIGQEERSRFNQPMNLAANIGFFQGRWRICFFKGLARLARLVGSRLYSAVSGEGFAWS